MNSTINSCDVSVYTPRPTTYRFRTFKVKKYNSKRLYKKERNSIRRSRAEEQCNTCSKDATCKCSECDSIVASSTIKECNDFDFWETFDFDEYTNPTGLDSSPYDFKEQEY